MPSRLQYTSLTPEQMLERALGERAEVAVRPQRTPRQVLGMWMENAGAGIGVGAIAGVGLYFLGAPDSVWLGGTAGTSIVVWGLLMAARGSADERAVRSSERQVRRAMKAVEQSYHGHTARLQAQLDRALDALDEADATEAQLRRSLDTMTRERDIAIYDLTREREQAAQRTTGRNSFVAPVELAPQDIRDATEMIRYRYDTGDHLSRRKAESVKKWTQTRWDAAKTHLDQARVISIINGVTEYPETMDEALQTFAAYMLQAHQLSVPTINRTVGKNIYVESDEG